MTTIRSLAEQLGFQTTYGLRAFTDDLLTDLPDDRQEIPEDIERVIREAADADAYSATNEDWR